LGSRFNWFLATNFQSTQRFSKYGSLGTAFRLIARSDMASAKYYGTNKNKCWQNFST
jgi:hypothetical protein